MSSPEREEGRDVSDVGQSLGKLAHVAKEIATRGVANISVVGHEGPFSRKGHAPARCGLLPASGQLAIKNFPRFA